MVTTAPAATAPPRHEPRLYPGVSYGDYASRFEGARASTLRHFERSAAHAREAMIAERQSAALAFGSAYHYAVLEPELFAVKYARGYEGDGRRTEAKELKASIEASGRTALPWKEHDKVLAMAAALRQHETAAALLSAPGANEVVVVWDDAETGVRCRARLDRICSWMGWTWVPDLKTTVDASPQGWPRQVEKYGYADAAAFYTDGLLTLDPRERRFLWIAQEKEPPYAVAIHEPDDETLAFGRKRYRRHLRAYAEAMRTDSWPAYPVGVLPSSLPTWALREESRRPVEDDEEEEEETA